jgi:hypothetical protein
LPTGYCYSVSGNDFAMDHCVTHYVMHCVIHRVEQEQLYRIQLKTVILTEIVEQFKQQDKSTETEGFVLFVDAFLKSSNIASYLLHKHSFFANFYRCEFNSCIVFWSGSPLKNLSNTF